MAKDKWHVDRFDGVFGGWYATDGDRETPTYLLRAHALIVAWWRNLRGA